MKHRALTGWVASSATLLLTLGFACVDADIPNISNNLRNALEETYGSGGAPVGAGGSASTPLAGSGGAPDDGDDDDIDPNDGAAGSSMASAGAGGGGDDDDEGDDEGGAGAGGAPPATGTCNGFAVLQQNCSGSACHSQPGAPLGDFAASEDAAREFIGRGGAVSCAGQGDLIDQDNPEDSLIILKMSGDPPCGTQMPPSGVPLSDDDVACVEDWITGL